KRQEPKVKLTLLKASAERIIDDEVINGQRAEQFFIRCQAVLDNSTGSKLKVRTNFGSAFDGLEVVVTDVKGKVLVRRGYTEHQSPSAFDKEIPLKVGKTEGELRFLELKALPKGVKKVKIRLVGTLPGSKFKGKLSSNTVEVAVKAGAK